MAELQSGFLNHVRRRIIVISTMEHDVRLAFIAGSVMVAVAIALNIFHDHLGPAVSIAIGRIPLGVVAALAFGEFAVFFFVSLAMLLLKGYWRFAVHGLAVISFALFVAINLYDVLAFGLIVPLGMLWTFIYLGKQQGWTQREYILAALSTSLAAMVIFVLYAATGRQLLIVSALAWQGLVAMFGLCAAATDIAELIVVAVESGTARLAKQFTATRVALGIASAAAVAVVLLTLTSSNWSSRSIASTLGAGLGLSLWLGLIYWMIVSRRKKLKSVHPHIEYWVLFFIIGFYFVAWQAGIVLRVLSDPMTYKASDLFEYPQVFIFTTLGALAFIIAFLIFGRRSERLLVGLAYGVTAGFFIFHYYSSQGSNIIVIVDAVAIGSLLFLGVARLSRKMRDNYGAVCWIVAELNLAFLFYALTATLFLSMGAHGHTNGWTVGQALVVLLALAWDMISSGETITNRDTESFPRLARVAVFIAYIMSVALLVMVATAGQFVHPVRGEAVENIFNSEGLVGVGLVMFGAPFIFMIAMLRLRNVLVAADAQLAPKAGPKSQVPPSLENEALPARP